MVIRGLKSLIRTGASCSLLCMVGIAIFLTNVSVCRARTEEKLWEVRAEFFYENSETGYQVRIHDAAGVLNDSQREILVRKMAVVTAYGSAVLVTTQGEGAALEEHAADFYERSFSDKSGIIVCVDVQTKRVWLWSRGGIHRLVQGRYARRVAEDASEQAAEDNAYECAYEAFDKIEKLLEGAGENRPVKYISNALLALMLAFFVNYLLVDRMSRRQEANEAEVLDMVDKTFYSMAPQIEKVSERVVRMQRNHRD